MEVMIAWSSHHSFLLKNTFFQLGRIYIQWILEKVLQAYTALQLSVLLGWFYFEIIVVIVGEEYPRDEESRTELMLEEQDQDLNKNQIYLNKVEN